MTDRAKIVALNHGGDAGREEAKGAHEIWKEWRTEYSREEVGIKID